MVPAHVWGRPGLPPLTRVRPGWYRLRVDDSYTVWVHTVAGYNVCNLERATWMELKRPDATCLEPGGRPATQPREDGWSSIYPGLHLMLTAERWPDGTARTPCTLLFCCEGGWIKLCLTDKNTDPELVAWTTARSITEALQGLEENLQAGDMIWRTKKPYGGKKR